MAIKTPYNIKVSLCLSILVVAALAANVLASAELYTHWKFDETTGTIAYDSSGNGLDGTLVGGYTFDEVSVPGAVDRAVFLNGTDSVIAVGPFRKLTYHQEWTTRGFTLSGWVKRDGFQLPWSGLFFTHELDCPYHAAFWYGLGFYSNQHTLTINWGDSWWYWNSGLFVPDNQWTFVAMTLEPIHYWGPDPVTGFTIGFTHMSLYAYANNKLNVAETPMASTLWMFSRYGEFPSVIGGIPFEEDKYYRGAVDDFRMYKDSMSYYDFCHFLGVPSHSYLPSPADEAEDLLTNITLTWQPGYAADGNNQDLYFGSDYDDVASADTSSGSGLYVGRMDTLSWLAGDLDLGKTYYWRTDDVDSNGVTYQGRVWSFTTKPYVVVEDYESYPDANSLTLVWTDATVNNPASVILDDIHPRTGRCSMQMYYRSNSAPYYSETCRSFASPQDFTRKNIKALVLNFYITRISGSSEPMYISLYDTDGHVDEVYYNGDLGNLTQLDWHEWNVNLADYTGINLHSITKMGIGFGNRSNPVNKKNSGYVCFDDIQLHMTRCRPEIGPLADLNDDCIVNYEDIKMLQNDWLVQDSTRETFLWYKFDEAAGSVAYDFNGNYHATINKEGLWRTQGVTNGCLYFDGTEGLKVSPNMLSGITNAITIAFWIKGEGQPQRVQDFIIQAPSSANYATIIHCPAPPIGSWYPGVSIFWRAGRDEPSMDYDEVVWYDDPEHPFNWNDNWHHYAFTKDASTGEMRIYRDSYLIEEKTNAFKPVGPWADFRIGERIEDGKYKYHGWMDDFRIYDRALTANQVRKLVFPPLGDPVSPKYYPILSPANMSETEEEGDRKVNLKDYSVLANTWLEERLWP